MDIEKKVKVFLILGILFLFFIYLEVFVNFRLAISWLLTLAVFFVALLVAIELYLRLQHNIERKFIRTMREVNTLGEALDIKLGNNLSKNLRDLDSKLSDNLNVLDNKLNKNAKDLWNKMNKNVGKLDSLKESFDAHKKELSGDIANISQKGELQLRRIDHFYWVYNKERRVKRLLILAPDLFKYKTLFYIGARKDRYDFLEMFEEHKYDIDILEVFGENVRFLKTLSWVSKVIKGDVTKFKPKKKYDIVFWWHGPEHVRKGKLAKVLKVLESSARKMVVLGCPWGNVSQSKELEEENPYEKHLNSFDIGFFEKRGYKTDYFGIKDVMGSNIIAVKEVKK